MSIEKLKAKIREVPDWPKKGILFYDATPVFENKDLFKDLIDELVWLCQDKEIDKFVGIDARGFILAAALAYKLNKGLVIVRKKGKLPYQTIEQSYGKEYGADCLEIHQDSIKPGEKVVICDDLLATGGTIKATVDLVSELKGEIVSILFFIELGFLDGRKELGNLEVQSLIKY